MDYVIRSKEDADFLANRENQFFIDFAQVGFVFRGLAVDLVLGGREVTEEVDALVGIVITPLPLVTGNLDGHVRVAGVAQFQQCLGCRNRHGNQDQERDDSPDDFKRITVAEGCRLATRTLSVRNDGIKHDSGYQHHDRGSNHENQVVQIQHLAS